MNFWKEYRIWCQIDRSRDAAGTAPPDDSHLRLHEQLRDARPFDEPPADLHGSIMSGLRLARGTERVEVSHLLSHWSRAWAIPAVAAIVLTLGLAVMLLDRPFGAGTPGRAAAPNLVPGMNADAYIDQVQFSVLGPLQEELQRVGRDATNAAQFLLSSFP